MLHLQRAAGNRAVGRWLATTRGQTPLWGDDNAVPTPTAQAMIQRNYEAQVTGDLVGLYDDGPDVIFPTFLDVGTICTVVEDKKRTTEQQGEQVWVIIKDGKSGWLNLSDLSELKRVDQGEGATSATLTHEESSSTPIHAEPKAAPTNVGQGFELGWTSTDKFGHFTMVTEPDAEERFFWSDDKLAVNERENRIDPRTHRLQVKARGEDFNGEGVGWVDLDAVVGPGKAKGEKEIASLEEEANEELAQQMAEQLTADVEALMSERQPVQVLQDTRAQTGESLLKGDTVRVVDRAEAKGGESELWANLRVEVIQSQKQDLIGKELVISRQALASANDLEDIQQSKEKQAATRRELSDQEVADTVLNNSVIAAYTSQKQVEIVGHIHYVDDQSFVLAFVKSFSDPRLKGRDRQRLERLAEDVGGFRFDTEMYVKQERKGLGTEIHEAIHRYSEPAVLTALGWHFNEGVTEYFTRQITAEKNILREDEYFKQYNFVQGLVEGGYITADDLKQMYFRGAANLLLTRLKERMSGQFSYQAFIAAVEQERFWPAIDYLLEHARK